MITLLLLLLRIIKNIILSFQENIVQGVLNRFIILYVYEINHSKLQGMLPVLTTVIHSELVSSYCTDTLFLLVNKRFSFFTIIQSGPINLGTGVRICNLILSNPYTLYT